MTDLLASASQLFTWVITCLTSLLEFVTSQPVILIGTLMTICGFVIGVAKRVIRIR